MGSPKFEKKLRKVSDDTDFIYSEIYKKLSLYTYNEGKKFGGSWLPFYSGDEFKDIFSKTNEIQLLIEKMIAKNYNIKI